MPKRVYYRTLDLLAGSGIWLAAAPWMVLIVLAITLEDGLREPMVCKETRVGLDGRTYDAFRFRTMRGGRITRVGAVLRRLGLDELPRVINVMRGEVSLILKNDRTLRF